MKTKLQIFEEEFSYHIKELMELEKKKEKLWKDKIEPLKSKIDDEKVAFIEMILELALYEDNSGGMKFHKKQDDFLTKKFKYLRRNGWIPENYQSAIVLSIPPNKPEIIDEICKEIEEVLPVIKPLTQNHRKYSGYKLIDVFEHTLSENGGVDLYISSDHTKFIVKEHYCDGVIFDNLKDAIKLIQEKHWYE